ncbi:MAG: hypothetical protein M1825_000886 [Sarcosagium campestre]|nr:MAG: hypothetical protein M1825_000886 [Sarcosagium campestre]
MAPSDSLILKANSGSPYQLSHDQTTRATTALLKHMKAGQVQKISENGSRDLLARADDDSEDEVDEDPIWLVLTTKKHITDKKRLKPSKIAIPFPLNTSSSLSICLITIDPQRAFKDVISNDAFPQQLRSRITRVIGTSKLRAKYKSYESRRQLFAEHDFFLADDRAITLLPGLLGKIFYGSAAKRPIPVDISGGSKARASKKDGEKSVAQPAALATAIERALSSALLYLSPSTCTSVKVGRANWEEAKVVANVEAVVEELVEKFVPKKWRGVRGLHIKGPTTAALPLWLADELWTDERDILGDAPPESIGAEKETVKAIAAKPVDAAKLKKRKAAEEVPESKGVEATKKKKSKKSKGELTAVTEGKEVDVKLRKERLKRLKAQAAAELEEDDGGNDS